MATPYHPQCCQFKRYNLFQCTFLTKCIQIWNISPFLIRPSVRYLSTFPPGEGIALRRPCKHLFIGQLSKTDKHNFQIHPRRGYHILYLISNISYLLSCAFGDGQPSPRGNPLLPAPPLLSSPLSRVAFCLPPLSNLHRFLL